VTDELATLQAEFPEFWICREIVRDRSRYVARSRQAGLHPHTVVTADQAELRQALGPPTLVTAPASVTTGPPAASRLDHDWPGTGRLGAGRGGADAMSAQFPEITQIARANRAFLARAVRHVARQGITQFLDVGTRLPRNPNTHHAAREISPGARVCYLDNGPAMHAHAQALLAAEDRVWVAAGDIRDAATALTDPVISQAIDPGAPACVLLVSVLHSLTAGQADAAVAAFRKWLAPGSFLVISAGTPARIGPEPAGGRPAAYGNTAPVAARTAQEITGWFDGFCLVEPGLTDVWAWRPDGPRRTRQPPRWHARFLAGVARKPVGVAAASAGPAGQAEERSPRPAD
jgi:hypothetical protein